MPRFGCLMMIDRNIKYWQCKLKFIGSTQIAAVRRNRNGFIYCYGDLIDWNVAHAAMMPELADWLVAC